MLFTYLHGGDLALWELFLILAVWGVLLLVFVGLPLWLIGYIIYKVVERRREKSQDEPP